MISCWAMGLTQQRDAVATIQEIVHMHLLRGQLGRPGGTCAYFRLSTRPLDQTLAAVPTDPVQRDQRNCDVLAGGYMLRTTRGTPGLTLVGTGVVMPEVLAAADQLASFGIGTDVVCLTSGDLLYRAVQARRGLRSGDDAVLDRLFPADRAAPIVTVVDGHPHTLSFLAGIHGTPTTGLGVSDFGRSGDVTDLYHAFGIDTPTIVGAAWDLLDDAVPTRPA